MDYGSDDMRHWISILAPLAGRDYLRRFNATYSLISILAPLAGRDPERAYPVRRHRHFNPRAPCGARLSRPIRKVFVQRFQSSRPLRGATHHQGHHLQPDAISILAPLAGRDGVRTAFTADSADFNTRAPCGARRRQTRRRRKTAPFQSSRPLRGATTFDPAEVSELLFQSSRPLRGATAKMHKNRVCFCNNRQRTNAFSPVKRRLSGR